MVSKFLVSEIEISGEKVSVDSIKLGTIQDISETQMTVATELVHWARLVGAAKKELLEHKSFYVQWKAAQMEAALTKTHKLPEWKLKVIYETNPAYLPLNRDGAQLEENLKVCEGVFLALQEKAQLARSAGAMARSELGATNMTTPSEEPRGWGLGGDSGAGLSVPQTDFRGGYATDEELDDRDDLIRAKRRRNG